MKDFYEEQKARNSVTRSARQRTGGKKKYLLPSDRLSPSELKKMNGEIAVYEMKKPISWQKFKGYPKDVQKEYLQWFADEFGATVGMMGKMFGISNTYLSTSFKKMGLADILHRGTKQEGLLKFNSWLKEQNPEIEEVPIPEEPKKEKVKVVEQPMFFNTITGCEMNFEGKASEISQTLFTLFRDQRIAVSVVFLGAKEESVNEDGNT